jgi:prepilin-type N-terminal cleavage/methylation domain-containing protein
VKRLVVRELGTSGGGRVLSSIRSRGLRQLVTGIAVSLGWINGGPACAQVYTTTTIDTFGGDVSAAQGINDDGVVVGTARNAAGKNHAFTYSDGNLTDLGTLGGSESQGLAINDAGQVAGFSHTAAGLEHAFRYSGGVMTDLGTLGGSSSYGLGINSVGQVVGGATTIADRAYHAFRYTSSMTDLGSLGGPLGSSEAAGIDADGSVVGYTSLGDFTDRAFVYRGGMMTPLGTLGGDYSYAQAIRNGVIVGGSYDAGDVSFRAVRWNDTGVAIDLGVLPGLSGSVAYALNATGQIVGKSDAGNDPTARAFLDLSGTMIDLNSLILPDSGWVLQQARGINDAGQVVGFGTFGGQTRGFLLNLSGKIWSNPSGGDFADSANWYSPGVPGSTDSVAFALDATYAVNITEGASSKSVDVTRGGVQFNLTGPYEVAQTMTVASSASLTIAGNGSLVVGGAMHVSGGRILAAADHDRLLKVGAIETSAGGIVDLNDNKMQVTGGSTYAQVIAQISSARNGGAWNGAGITSGAARGSSSTTLGVLTGGEYRSIYGAGASFEGSSVADSDVLVKYTWYGDTDFNGTVNFDDYVRTDNGFNNQLSGFANGDFDLNGTVNFDDYVLIDLAFNTQSGTLARAMHFIDGSDRSPQGMESPALRALEQHFAEFGQPYASAFLASVPEPFVAGIAGAVTGAVVIGGRHRRGIARSFHNCQTEFEGNRMMRHFSHQSTKTRSNRNEGGAARLPGFTLVELLVVIAVIAVLIGVLLPTLARARRQASKIQCQSNLRQVGAQLLIYAQKWNGWIVPPERGFDVAPEERWPVYVFKPAVYNPPELKCPTDDNPDGDHSYVLNQHLVDKHVKYGSRIPLGISPAEVVVAGEKIASRDDYYMNGPDYVTLIDQHRHGRINGNNILFLDLHVGAELTSYQFSGKIDPWDVPAE